MDWKTEVSFLLNRGCTDSDIEEFIDENPEAKAEEVWDYVYLENKFMTICKSIPSWILCDELGGDSELVYILNLTTVENYNLANKYLTEKCHPSYGKIDRKYIGKKVILEFDRCDKWYYLHGDIDEFFERAKKTFMEHLKRIEK